MSTKIQNAENPNVKKEITPICYYSFFASFELPQIFLKQFQELKENSLVEEDSTKQNAKTTHRIL